MANDMLPAKIANVMAHTGLPESRATDLVTGKVRLHYRLVPRLGHTHCAIRFAIEVASAVHHAGDPTENCTCKECESV